MDMDLRSYLIERRKAGTGAYYIVRTVEAAGMRHAAEQVAGDFAPGDTLRMTLLSVGLEVTLLADRQWKVIDAVEVLARPA